MARPRKHNAVRERITFSTSPDLKKRVQVVADLMSDRSFSSAVRRIVLVGLQHFERHYGLSDGQINLFASEEETQLQREGDLFSLSGDLQSQSTLRVACDSNVDVGEEQ